MSDSTLIQSKFQFPNEGPNPSGRCLCGCGLPAPIAIKTDTKAGWIKGQPTRFIHGHRVRIQKYPPLAERFWDKVDCSGGPDACFIWTGAKDSGGYGQVSINGHLSMAHRVSWEIHNGPIQDGLCVLHNCPDGDNPACVNPAHLWLGTQAQNGRDRANKGRNNHVVGSAHPSSKLTEGDVITIRKLAASGISTYVLSDQYGVTKENISAIVTRKTWRHIE